MANNTELNPGIGGDLIDTDDLLGVKTQGVKLRVGAPGVDDGLVDADNPLPTEIRAFSGTVEIGPGHAAGTLRVELPTDGQGRVFVRNSPVISAPTTVTSIPFDETSVQIVGPSAHRKSVMLFNDGNFDVLLGIGEPAGPNGQKIVPGAYLTFDYVGSIYGYNLIANGADVVIRATEESY